MAAERLRQEAPVLDDFLDRVHFRESKDALLQVDHDQSGLGVKGG
jgi:hypothetical protein